MTFHPIGPADSSEMLNDAKWLDFNMYQSSHAGRDLDNGVYAEHDLQLKPERPTLDAKIAMKKFLLASIWPAPAASNVLTILTCANPPIGRFSPARVATPMATTTSGGCSNQPRFRPCRNQRFLLRNPAMAYWSAKGISFLEPNETMSSHQR